MHISHVGISNVLSFPYQQHLHIGNAFSFDVQDGGKVTICIGPNGSGKSNFLEIVNQVLKVGLFKDFVLHTTPLKENDVACFSQVLEEKNQTFRYLKKHFSHEDKKSSLYVRLHMGEGDWKNICHVYRHKNLLEKMISDYSLIDLSFPVVANMHHLREIVGIDLQFSIDYQAKKIVLKNTTHDPVMAFWLLYLQYFELFQLCFVLHNHYLMRSPLAGLHGCFATLGASREFSDYAMLRDVRRFSGSDLDEIVYAQDTKKHSQPPVGYYLCKKRILERSEANRFQLKQEQIGLLDSKANYHSHFVEMLSYFVKRYVGLTLLPVVKHHKIVLYFVDDYDNRLRITDLSSGQQSFLYLIFTLFGYGLGHGVIIIDEPEMHLHPQMQATMLELLEEIAKKYDIQVIVATHSPLMINERTIHHVLRMTWQSGATDVHINRSRFSASESQLMQMLRFGYTAKIFFVNTIIMVEGETDEFFLDFYLHWLKTQAGWSDRIKDFAVINVNGKGGYKRWKKFLRKFGIRSFFLGDWDNIVDTGFAINFSHLHREMRQHPRFRGTKHYKKAYGKLVRFVQEEKPELHQAIQEHIEGWREDDVFIMQYGDLEAYLGLRLKGVDSTVYFCHHEFDSWLEDDRFIVFRDELLMLMRKVFALNFSSIGGEKKA